MLIRQLLAVSLLARFERVALFRFTFFDVVEIPLQGFGAVTVCLCQLRFFALVFQPLEGLLILVLFLVPVSVSWCQAKGYSRTAWST